MHAQAGLGVRNPGENITILLLRTAAHLREDACARRPPTEALETPRVSRTTPWTFSAAGQQRLPEHTQRQNMVTTILPATWFPPLTCCRRSSFLANVYTLTPLSYPSFTPQTKTMQAIMTNRRLSTPMCNTFQPPPALLSKSVALGPRHNAYIHEPDLNKTRALPRHVVFRRFFSATLSSKTVAAIPTPAAHIP